MDLLAFVIYVTRIVTVFVIASTVFANRHDNDFMFLLKSLLVIGSMALFAIETSSAEPIVLMFLVIIVFLLTSDKI